MRRLLRPSRTFAAVAVLMSMGACELDPYACCTEMDFDAHYRAEFGPGANPEHARADCEKAGGAFAEESCARDEVVGQCAHERAYDDEPEGFTYTELYLVGFGNNDYDTPEELAALERACVELRGGRFVAGADREDE